LKVTFAILAFYIDAPLLKSNGYNVSTQHIAGSNKGTTKTDTLYVKLAKPVILPVKAAQKPHFVDIHGNKSSWVTPFSST
jgi:hypothetical protein